LFYASRWLGCDSSVDATTMGFRLLFAIALLKALRGCAAGAPVSNGVLKMINMMLSTRVKPMLNEAIPAQIKKGRLDPLPAILDQPIIHLKNLTGLSSAVIDSIQATSVNSTGKLYDARLVIHARATEVLTAIGFAGLEPHQIAVRVLIAGARITSEDVRAEVDEDDLLFTRCDIEDLRLDYDEVRFVSEDVRFSDMLNFVAPAYKAVIQDWVAGNVRERLEYEFSKFLPFSHLAWPG